MPKVRSVYGVRPGVSSSPMGVPVAASHTRVVPRPPVVAARVEPSRLYATPSTSKPSPFKAGPNGRWVAMSNWRTVPDGVPTAMVRPSGAMSRAVTESSSGERLPPTGVYFDPAR